MSSSVVAVVENSLNWYKLSVPEGRYEGVLMLNNSIVNKVAVLAVTVILSILFEMKAHAVARLVV